MSENENNSKKTLTVGKTLSIKKPSGQSGTVAVEVKKRRHSDQKQESGSKSSQHVLRGGQNQKGNRQLTGDEFENRFRALQEAQRNMLQEQQERMRKDTELEKFRAEQARLQSEQNAVQDAREEKKQEEKAAELAEKKVEELKSERKDKKPLLKANEHHKKKEDYGDRKKQEVDNLTVAPSADKPLPQKFLKPEAKTLVKKVVDEDAETLLRNDAAKKAVVPPKKGGAAGQAPKKFSKQQLNRVMEDGFEERERSFASLKRHRQKNHKQLIQAEVIKVVRDVIIPETINVGELANRMAVRSADVVKSLMKLGVMATINQSIDADTAELICTEFGHTPKRVSEDDFETNIKGQEDAVADCIFRAPVVTIMGHVDHGKTSLLDALRKTDVVSGEAGGITQHIGAYQVTLTNGKKITFIDTPGHAAFSEMRSRGANVTDIVVLVVAADDGIKEQTVEAINHAKAANVPIIVAINKIDKPEANADRVRTELMTHNILLEEFGGEVMSVEVSAKKNINLDKLEETILLQAEVLELKANPNRTAQGVVVEAQVDKGRGVVATVLVQRGTLNVGDVYVAGTECGRVRALIDHHGHKIKMALPSQPVEVLGFDGVPVAGDEFIVVEDEATARDAAAKRLQRKRELANKVSAKMTMEKLMGQIAAGEAKELAIIVKADVHGSLEAIMASLTKLSTAEISVRILHGGVGAINESDVTLARASQGVVLGFNVRANPQARDLSRRDGVDLRYYSIIYNLIDDMKSVMGGLLSPTLREKYLGQAQIRAVFSVPKMGKAAGCMITEGLVKRGSKVRLLRDNIVIHEGTLKSLRRFKDEVKEVKEGYECGMAFENYQDLKEGDIIECFDIEEIARQL